MTCSGRIYGEITAIPKRFLPYLNILGIVRAGSERRFTETFNFETDQLLPLERVKRMHMTFMFGKNLKKIFRFLRPNLKVIYITCYLDNEDNSVSFYDGEFPGRTQHIKFLGIAWTPWIIILSFSDSKHSF